MKKILVPTDFSEQAENALDFACDIAVLSGAQVLLINIVEYPATLVDPMGASAVNAMDTRFYHEMLEQSKTRLRSIKEDAKYTGLQISCITEGGNPFQSISTTVVEHEVDLVIMGTKGTSGIEEIFIGSNAEKVVRHAKCPVFTIKEPVKANQIKDIAFAMDAYRESNVLVEKLKQLQHLFNARLHMVCINTPNNFEREVEIRKKMMQFAEQYELRDYSIAIFSDMSEEQGIISFAEEIDAGMIAMGTHGRTGIAHLLGGSIAEDVVNHGVRPIWTCSFKI